MIAAIWAVSLLILALLAISAVFSAAETALTGASRGRMHQLERDGDRAAGRVNRLLSDQETMIGAVLIGYNVLNILSSALATEFITRVVPGAWGPSNTDTFAVADAPSIGDAFALLSRYSVTCGTRLVSVGVAGVVTAAPSGGRGTCPGARRCRSPSSRRAAGRR